MSLILEALRKSEAERRRGQSPDLFAATPGAPPLRSERARVWPLLLLAAMLLGSAWLIWSAGRAPAPDSVPIAAPAEAESGSGAAASPIPAAPVPAPPKAAAAQPLAPAPTASLPASASAPPRTGPPQPAAPTHARTEPAAANAAAAPAPLPVPPPAASVDTTPADPELPPLAVLDTSTRAALPPLKLSMHVYADDPARRFAIIDGQRITEGARVGAGVVAQIRRDGVVIDVDGRRVLLPKP